jgi:hypothetical protein
MNSKLGIFTNLLCLLVGVTFICMQSRENVLQAIVVILGALFIVAGAVNMVILYRSVAAASSAGVPYNRAGRIAGSIACVAALALGILMVVSPGAVINMIVYTFAVLLLLGGLYRIYMLAFGYRPLHFPRWFYIGPTLLVITGITLLAIGGTRIQNYIVLITGIAMVVFAVSSFLEYTGLRAYEQGVSQVAPSTDNVDTPTDVDATEV